MKWKEWMDRPVPAPNREYHGEIEETKFLDGTNWEYYKEFLDEFRYEYNTSLAFDLELVDFQGWVALEEFFGQRIDYLTYMALSSYFCEQDVDLLSLGGNDPLWDAYRKGDSALYRSQDDAGKKKEKCLILGVVLAERGGHLSETGPLYDIRLEDGREEMASYDELSLARKKK